MPARRDILTGGLSLAVLAAVGAPARAEAALRGDFVQGTLIRGKTEPGAAVSCDGRKLKLTETGDFVFGVAYDRTEPAALKIALPGGETEEKPLAFALREYKVQRIDGLPDKFVEPPPEVTE